MADAVAVDELGPGDHACLTFSDPQERLDLVARFVRDGIRRRQRVLCLTDAVPVDRLVKELGARSVGTQAAVRRGQLLVAPIENSLLGPGPPTAGQVATVVAAEFAHAARAGFSGVRVTADMCWATRPGAPADQLASYENCLHELFTDGRLCVICQYDRERFDEVTLAFAASLHPKTVAATVYHESVLLRVCRQYSPPGVRIAGELDYRHQDALEQALGESRRLDRHMHVNLAELDYIDAACATVIVQTAARLPASRRMTVTARSLVSTVLDLVGAHAAPRLRVLQVHGER
jgi:MEDS: MEthanogen/methylotroph, DcmR Sensory domain